MVVRFGVYFGDRIDKMDWKLGINCGIVFFRDYFQVFYLGQWRYYLLKGDIFLYCYDLSSVNFWICEIFICERLDCND